MCKTLAVGILVAFGLAVPAYAEVVAANRLSAVVEQVFGQVSRSCVSIENDNTRWGVVKDGHVLVPGAVIWTSPALKEGGVWFSVRHVMGRQGVLPEQIVIAYHGDPLTSEGCRKASIAMTVISGEIESAVLTECPGKDPKEQMLAYWQQGNAADDKTATFWKRQAPIIIGNIESVIGHCPR